MSEKKWATCQSFIRKEITTYRIGTLDDARISASEKDLPVPVKFVSCMQRGGGVSFHNRN